MRRYWFESLHTAALISAKRFPRRRLTGAVMAGLICLPTSPLPAQEPLVRPGEAFVTRFSGVTTASGAGGQASA